MSAERFSRQSFLGDQSLLRQCIVGVVGNGGGGSHIVQQLAHLGIKRFRVFDPDHVDDSNLNRLIGASAEDVTCATPKVYVAERVIRSLVSAPDIILVQDKWQHAPELLKECDIVFGCVDSLAARRDLELLTRRYLIPYIDIGMDVHCVDGQPPRMAGQVILSMPGGPCMFCLGFLTEDALGKEVSGYGDAGYRPQVVWPNGILASAAVDIAVELLTDWSRSMRRVVYLQYDANEKTLKPHVRLQFLSDAQCEHYGDSDVGDLRAFRVKPVV